MEKKIKMETLKKIHSFYAVLTNISFLWKFIFPLYLEFKKSKSEFVDHHGKQAINFQLSIVILWYLLLLLFLHFICTFPNNCSFDAAGQRK
jgi:uncharacterized Tic20 family protein